MANINVNRSVNDPFYRYKMPKIMAKIEGKGNGIKTVIVNMTDVAKALARPPTYTTKYFGSELGAQTKCDSNNDRYIVNGSHDANKLQDILDGFIKKFVLCPSCENPETTLTVKNKAIHSKCKACGHAFMIDPKHKLATFIIKNPPSESAEIENNSKKDGKSPDRADKTENDAPDDAVNNSNEKEADEDWASDPGDCDVQHLSSGVSKLILDSDSSKPEGERLDLFFQFLNKAKADGSIENSKTILNESERLEVKSKAPLLLCQVLFDADILKLKQIDKYRTLLLRFCLNDSKAQKFLLAGIEQLCDVYKNTLLPKVAHIVKKLYDEDICTEEVILSWGSKPSKKYVDKEMSKQIREKCADLLKWLEEAEEESESESVEDEEIQFDDRAVNVGAVVVKPRSNGTKEDDAKIMVEDGEEIDIDDI